jgi:hypothetical protein
LTSMYPLASSQGILFVCQPGAQIVEVPLSDKQAVSQV